MASSAALFGTLILLPFYLTAVLGFSPVQLALGDHADRRVVHARRAARGPRDRPRGLGPARDGRLRGRRRRARCGWRWRRRRRATPRAARHHRLRRRPGRCPPPPITATAIHDVPRRPARRRLGAAQHQPLHRRRPRRGPPRRDPARPPAGRRSRTRSGRVAPAGRDLVADGFRTALLVAAGFLLAGGARRVAHAPPGRARAGAVAAAAAPRRAGGPVSALRASRLPGAGARHAGPHRPGRGARLRVGLVLRLAAALPRPVRHARAGRRPHRAASGWASACVVPGLRAPGGHRRPALRTLTALAPGRVRAARGRRVHRAASPSGWGRCRSRAPRARGRRPARAARRRGAPPTSRAARRSRDMPVPGAEGDGEVPLYVSCRGPRAQALARRDRATAR